MLCANIIKIPEPNTKKKVIVLDKKHFKAKNKRLLTITSFLIFCTSNTPLCLKKYAHCICLDANHWNITQVRPTLCNKLPHNISLRFLSRIVTLIPSNIYYWSSGHNTKTTSKAIRICSTVVYVGLYRSFRRPAGLLAGLHRASRKCTGSVGSRTIAFLIGLSLHIAVYGLQFSFVS